MNANDILRELLNEAALQIHDGCIDEYYDPEDALEHLFESATVTEHDARTIVCTEGFISYCDEFEEDARLYDDDEMTRAVVRYLWTKAHDVLLPLIEARIQFMNDWREFQRNIANLTMEDE